MNVQRIHGYVFLLNPTGNLFKALYDKIGIREQEKNIISNYSILWNGLSAFNINRTKI